MSAVRVSTVAILRNSGLLALLLSLPALALEVPAGTELQIRLRTKVSTQTSKPGDRMEAVVIAPVLSGDQVAIPAGAAVRGTVGKSTQSSAGQRAVLSLNFTEIEIDSRKSAISAQLAGVDNARETIDQMGQISGILASETASGQIDSGINKVAEKYSGFAGILEAAKNAVLKEPSSDITYDAGVEMTLKVSAPLTLAGPSAAGAGAGSIADESGLSALIAREPFQTMAQKPAKPSDITNLMLLGTEEALLAAFRDAGWSAAASLSTRSKFETFKAIAEDRGYSEAPVSILLLDGNPPDIVFEKTNNTFAKRHHLRIWRRPSTFQGQPVWAVAATHDIGISFSEQDRTFIHRIDSQIDTERAKVSNDLLFTGRVQGIALVERPNVPQHGQNATGDNLDTDGKIAVLQLK